MLIPLFESFVDSNNLISDAYTASKTPKSNSKSENAIKSKIIDEAEEIARLTDIIDSAFEKLENSLKPMITKRDKRMEKLLEYFDKIQDVKVANENVIATYTKESTRITKPYKTILETLQKTSAKLKTQIDNMLIAESKGHPQPPSVKVSDKNKTNSSGKAREYSFKSGIDNSPNEGLVNDIQNMITKFFTWINKKLEMYIPQTKKIIQDLKSIL